MKNNDLENYIASHCEAEPGLLRELTREVNLQLLQPRMLSGHVQGRVLKMIVQMIQPKRVLELGTFAGYSALCIAEGLSEEAVVDTIEINDELEEFAQYFFDKSPYTNRINLIIGDAIELLKTSENTYQMVFIDANKRHYLDYYKSVFPLVETGGYIIADNVLWDGHVVNSAKIDDPQTKGIVEFNDYVQADDAVENVLLPVRDGLMILRKK